MKRHILFLGAIVSFIALFTACSGGSSTKSGLSVDYMPFTKDEDGAIGMLDKDLKPLFAEEFEGEVSPVIDGVFWVREEGGNYSLYKAEKKPTVIKGCEDLVGVGIMSEGIIPIVKKVQELSRQEVEMLRQKTAEQDRQLSDINSRAAQLTERQSELAQNLLEQRQREYIPQQDEGQLLESLSNISSDMLDVDDEEAAEKIKSWIEQG